MGNHTTERMLIKDTYLLRTKGAARLYHGTAKHLPIIDYHNHLSVSDIADDKSQSEN